MKKEGNIQARIEQSKLWNEDVNNCINTYTTPNEEKKNINLFVLINTNL